jgi:hypothetical protein
MNKVLSVYTVKTQSLVVGSCVRRKDLLRNMKDEKFLTSWTSVNAIEDPVSRSCFVT